MATRKPLANDTDGFPIEISPTADDMGLGGLTMSGDITMGTTNSITGLAAGVNPQDAVNKQQLDNAVITGGSVKEALLDDAQLDNADGIYSASAFVMANNPVSGDTFAITDGTTTRTYGFGSGGDVTVTIGGSAAATMANLATSINGDGSAIWEATFTVSLEAINAPGVVMITEDDNSGTVSRFLGTWTTQADAQIVDFNAEIDYTKKSLDTLPTSDPGAGSTQFGFRRIQSALIDGEIHYMLESNSFYSWDDADNVWQLLAAGITQATSASGGGTIGVVTMDEDFGLQIAAGIATIKLASSGTGTGGLQFDGSGDIEIDLDSTTLQLLSAGISVKGVPLLFEVNGVVTTSGVTAANLNTLTDASNADSLHTHAALINPQFNADTGGVTIGDPLFYSADNVVSPTDTSDNNTRKFIGVADTTVTAGNPTGISTEGDIVAGVLTSLSATAGDLVYATTPNGLTLTVPSTSGHHRMVIGKAVNEDDLFISSQYLGKVA